MTVYTFDENTVSDLHKDARGFRPTAGWMDAWNFQDDEGKQAAWNTLIDELEQEIARESSRQQEAIKSFEDRIALLMNTGASDRDTAVRWLVDSLELSEIDKMYGGSHICYELGLPYSMEKVFDNVLKVNG